MEATRTKSSDPADRANGAGPPVVFLHGIGGAARVWTSQLQSFAAAGFRPVALDLPGYGARAPAAEMDFAELAADVEGAIAERALDRPVLVGHSMGGMIVQAALRRRPDGYRAAVLCCTSPAFGDPTGEFQKKFVADRLAPLDAGATMPALAPSIVDDIMAPSATRSPSRPWRRCRRRPIAPRCAASLRSTSAPICRTSVSPSCASLASTTATRRRK
jgi:pimeloyl-ACP methyl ester carboxylesterase